MTATSVEPTHRQYLQLMLTRLRHANHRANVATNRWEDASKWMDEYLAVNAARYTAFTRRERRRTDWGLNDAFDEWHFWQRESLRLSSAITAELAYLQLMERLP